MTSVYDFLDIVIEDYLEFLIYLIITMNTTMANINKKQVTFGLLAVVFATALFVSVVATSDSAFASNNHKHKWHKHHNQSGHQHDGKVNAQSISQSCHQNQRSTVLTAGANSPVLNSGNNAAVCTNTNNGGNAAAF